MDKRIEKVFELVENMKTKNNSKRFDEIDELSNDLLGRYKKKATDASRAADAVGDVKKANKRFSGVMKATKKQFANFKQKPVAEDTDGKDTVTLEIPALMRALEWAHEDAKNDVEIHKFVEKLINHEGNVDMEFFSDDEE